MSSFLSFFETAPLDFFLLASESRLLSVTVWHVSFLLRYNGSKITRVPLDVLSTKLFVAFSPSNQYFCI